MQSYSGPRNRRLTRYTGDYGFRKDGRVNYLENREVYITQTFDVEAISTRESVLPPYWWFQDEQKIVAPTTGDPLLFTEKHLLDNLCLNKTLTNVRFKPDNSFNALPIDNECLIRLAPLLSDKTIFNNVTQPPTYTDNSVEEDLPQYGVSIRHQAYDRLWFGFLQDDEDMSRFGSTLGGLNAAAQPVPDPEFSQAMGFLLRTFEHQPIAPRYYVPDEEWHTEGGNLVWDFDKETNQYKLEGQYITVPMHKFNPALPWAPDNETHHVRFLVPSLKTHGEFAFTKNAHCFFRYGDIDPGTVTRDAYLRERAGQAGLVIYEASSSAADAVGVKTEATRDTNESFYGLMNEDFIPIPLTPQVPGPDGNLKTLFWFIPSFYIIRGNYESSFGHPVRYRRQEAAAWTVDEQLTHVIDVPWENIPRLFAFHEVPTFLHGVNARNGTHNHSDNTGYWADYWLRKYRSSRRYNTLAVAVVREQAAAVNTPNVVYLDFTDFLALNLDNAASPIYTDPTSAAAQKYPGLMFEQGKRMHDYVESIRVRVVSARLDGAGDFLAYNNHVTRFGLKRSGPVLDYGRLIDKMISIEFNDLNRYEDGGNAFAEALRPLTNAALEAGAHPMSWPRVQFHITGNAFGQLNRANNNFSFLGQYTDGAGERLEAKPFHARSLFNMIDTANAAYNPQALPVLGNALYDGSNELFLPYLQPQEQNPSGATKRTYTCVEPLMGYTSGTTALQCKAPLQTSQFGSLFPPIVQDYQYSFTRDWSKLFSNGYVSPSGTHDDIKITPVTELEFSTIAEQDSFKQEDKSVSRAFEITHTTRHYTDSYHATEGSSVIAFPPQIQLESRQGQFEYAFMWCDYTHSHTSKTSQPKITSIRLWVEGNENTFVKDINGPELERLSRGNCHQFSDWRTLHNAGQGILLHLRDIGLTNEAPFPQKKRVHLNFQLREAVEPAIPDPYMSTEDHKNRRRFHVCIIRSNQLFTCGSVDCRFEFLNEKLLK